jgi:glycosyltransferase involved in cell wall biosynthesis
MKKRVALITHETSLVGGLPTMMTFLKRTLEQSGRYECEQISLATSATDEASLQITRPHTWFIGAQIKSLSWHDSTFTHVGVTGSELEFQRYRPRRALTQLLKQFDVLQFVVGSPPWVCVADDANRPIVLWTATTTRADRASRQRSGSLGRRIVSSVILPLTERYERRGLRAADKVLALSEYTREVLARVGGPAKVVIAPCGVDTNLFHPSQRGRQDYILCVARFSDARKNVRLLFDAYACVMKSLTDVPDLYLIGDPPSDDAQRQIKALGIAGKVKLIGPKRGEELASLYREASLFVLSSDEEGLGIVILEAMASGLAVISTNCGGPGTAIVAGETGLLTPIGDAAAFAGAMEKLLRDPELRERMGREARRVAEERFSLAAAGKIFLDTYDSLLAEKTWAARQTSPALSSIPATIHD